MRSKPETSEVVRITVKPPEMHRIEVEIAGTAPYAQHRFEHKSEQEILARQMEGSAAKSKKIRDAKNPDADFHASYYQSADGWYGIPSAAIRTAMVDACRTCNVVMTLAKMAFRVIHDGMDKDGKTPLTRLTEGTPTRDDFYCRLPTGTADIHTRALYKGWKAVVTLAFSEDMLLQQDVVNLLLRAGLFVGIGEGRPFSKKNAGQGYGTFALVEDKE